MPGRRHSRRRTGAALAPVLALACLTACAIPMAPTDGPMDKIPPELAAAHPESGSVGVEPLDRLVFLFSEKMAPDPAERFLHLYPEVEIRKTSWKGRREAHVILEEPLPADTVFVLEITSDLKDAHGVSATKSYRFPFATADSLPRGRLTGQLVLDGKPLVGGLVELYDVPPDTLEFFQQPIVRRTTTDSLGAFRLDWLPVPGGPWLLRTCADANGDLRVAENEAQRLLPLSVLGGPDAADTTGVVDLATRIARQNEPAEVVLDSARGRRNLGLTELFAPKTAGRLLGNLDSLLAWNGPVLAWSMTITDEDSGWTPVPSERRPAGITAVSRDTLTVIPGAGPGLVRLILFVDADGDSLLSALPAAAGRDTAPWFLEPHVVLDSLEVAPGLESAFPTPAFPVNLSSWTPAEPDSAPPTELRHAGE